MNVLVRIRYSHAFRFVPSVYQVLGVGRVAGHPQRGAVHLVEVGHGVALEPRGALLDGLLDRHRRPA
jgi:hypothetical protein